MFCTVINLLVKPIIVGSKSLHYTQLTFNILNINIGVFLKGNLGNNKLLLILKQRTINKFIK